MLFRSLPDEDKQSRFSYYLSTIGNSNLEFENMYYDIDYELGENLHNNIDDVLKNKNSDENMAPDSENVNKNDKNGLLFLSFLSLIPSRIRI